jgi:hypothetical protein
MLMGNPDQLGTRSFETNSTRGAARVLDLPQGFAPTTAVTWVSTRYSENGRQVLLAYIDER